MSAGDLPPKEKYPGDNYLAESTKTTSPPLLPDPADRKTSEVMNAGTPEQLPLLPTLGAIKTGVLHP